MRASTSGSPSTTEHSLLYKMRLGLKCILQVRYTILKVLEIIPNKKEVVCMSDFQLLKVIGKGGFSKVLLVRKKDSGLLFAMKVMEKSFVADDGKFRQVMCERNIMESLNHPFIVKLHWAFQSVRV